MDGKNLEVFSPSIGRQLLELGLVNADDPTASGQRLRTRRPGSHEGTELATTPRRWGRSGHSSTVPAPDHD